MRAQGKVVDFRRDSVMPPGPISVASQPILPQLAHKAVLKIMVRESWPKVLIIRQGKRNLIGREPLQIALALQTKSQTSQPPKQKHNNQKCRGIDSSLSDSLKPKEMIQRLVQQISCKRQMISGRDSDAIATHAQPASLKQSSLLDNKSILNIHRSVRPLRRHLRFLTPPNLTSSSYAPNRKNCS